MKAMRTSDKLSLTECKRLLNRNGEHYTDDEIIAIRDWLYLMAEMSVSEMPHELVKKCNTEKKQ